MAAGLGLMPLATGVAILRYRLYDLDRLVSRTIAYAVVTGGLVLAYLAINLGAHDRLQLGRERKRRRRRGLDAGRRGAVHAAAPPCPACGRSPLRPGTLRRVAHDGRLLGAPPERDRPDIPGARPRHDGERRDLGLAGRRLAAGRRAMSVRAMRRLAALLAGVSLAALVASVALLTQNAVGRPADGLRSERRRRAHAEHHLPDRRLVDRVASPREPDRLDHARGGPVAVRGGAGDELRRLRARDHRSFDPFRGVRGVGPGLGMGPGLPAAGHPRPPVSGWRAAVATMALRSMDRGSCLAPDDRPGGDGGVGRSRVRGHRRLGARSPTLRRSASPTRCRQPACC